MAYVQLLIIMHFLLCANTLSRILYVCGLQIFIFKLVIFVYYFFLRRLIVPESAMNGVFNIMSRPKTSLSGVACSIVWYVIHTSKAVAANIPDQGSSLS